MQVISRPVHTGGGGGDRACDTAAGTNASAIIGNKTATAEAKMLFISIAISQVISNN